ncbi:hypothetical protein OAL13_00265 [bacterium]|nr:hypothetical protein [bacterium]
MSLFRRGQRPTKRLNARGNNEITPIIGSMSYDAEALYAFSESDSDYKHGTNGLRDNPNGVQRRMVADEGEVRELDFSEVAELPTIKVSRSNRALAKLVEGQISGPLTREQRLDARKFLASPERRALAEELMTLRGQDTPLTRDQAMRKRLLEMKAGSLITSLTALLRSA